MELDLQRLASRNGFVESGKTTPAGSAVNVDVSGPFASRLFPSHTYYAAPVVGLRASVLAVLSVRRIA